MAAWPSRPSNALAADDIAVGLIDYFGIPFCGPGAYGGRILTGGISPGTQDADADRLVAVTFVSVNARSSAARALRCNGADEVRRAPRPGGR